MKEIGTVAEWAGGWRTLRIGESSCQRLAHPPLVAICS
jgi:hypothetical protein